jgi:hypothetical protein
MNHSHYELTLRRLGIDTYQEPVIYMRSDCHVCRAEGFAARSRVRVRLRAREVIATLNVVQTDLLKPNEASLSECAWSVLAAADGDTVAIAHPPPLASESALRAKGLRRQARSCAVRKRGAGHRWRSLLRATTRRIRHGMCRQPRRTLNAPDDKTLALLFAARTARELGATSVGLVAPYLAYMRQDRRFVAGEAITSVHFAALVSTAVDWLVFEGWAIVFVVTRDTRERAKSATP